ncbi:MAG: tetratricopeptide repeat protein [bacterium]
MHPFTISKRMTIHQSVILLSIAFLLFALAGCAGSSGLTKQEIEALQQQQAENTTKIDRLQSENTGLKQKLTTMEQDKSVLNSRFADIQSKYNAEREKAERAAAAITTETRSIPSTKPAVTGSYEDAKKAFIAKKYDDAIGILESLLKSAISDEQSDNCMYWLGEAYFGKKNYSEAMKHFESVLTLKKSEKKGDAQYMIGRCLEHQGKKAEAKAAYERVVKEYPMSDNLEHAKLRWGKL